MGIEPNKVHHIGIAWVRVATRCRGVITWNVEPSGCGSRPNQWRFVGEVQDERRPNGATSWTTASRTFLQDDRFLSCVFLEYEPLQ